jgi:hypothetical protein
VKDAKPRKPIAGRVVAAVAAALVLALVYELCVPHTVEFRVIGEGGECGLEVTYRDGSGSSQELHAVHPPWQSGSARARFGADLYVLATGRCDAIECTIVIDGKEWRKNRARSAVDCGGMLGE